MNINAEIKSLLDFYNETWDLFSLRLEKMKFRDELQKKDIIEDWLAFNWELILESTVCKTGEFLESYGDGTDSIENGIRFMFGDKEATHKVVCSGKKDFVKNYYNGKLVRLKNNDFYKFVNYNEEVIDYNPKFNYSIVITNEYENILVKNTDIDFFMIVLE